MGKVKNEAMLLAEGRREEIIAVTQLLQYAWLAQPDARLSQVIEQTLDPQATRFDRYTELFKRTDKAWAQRIMEAADKERIARVKAEGQKAE